MNIPNSLKRWLIFIVAAGVLTGIAIAVLAVFRPVPEGWREGLLLRFAGTWPTEFHELFDDQSLTHWKPTDGRIEEGVKRLSVTGGRFEVAFAPTQATTVRDAFFNERAVATDNFLLRVKINPPQDCHSGIIFRGTEQGDYYLFMVAKDSYTAEILTRNSDGDRPREAILPNTPFPAGLGQPETVEVLAFNDSYYFYINHIFVDQMSDTRLHGDRTGVEHMVCQDVRSDSVFKVEAFTLKIPFHLWLAQ